MAAVARNTDICGGAIIATATKTFVNGLLVARLGDTVTSHGTGPHAAATLVGCSLTVLVEGKGVCRFGDAATCGHTVSMASPSVNAG
jgi:uncharacterized Zn-binding protein involved in type VI secretion